MITWDYVSPRGEHWLEWFADGRRHLQRVTEEMYEAIKAKFNEELDFLN